MGISLPVRMIGRYTVLVMVIAGCAAMLMMPGISPYTRAGIAVCLAAGVLIIVRDSTGRNTDTRPLSDSSDTTSPVEPIHCEHTLAQLGQRAAGVAHELNNPLGGILMYANLIAEDMDRSEPHYTNLEKIIHETERCRAIVKRLLDIARQTPPTLTTARIDAILSEALATIRPVAERGDVRLHEDFSAPLPPVRADSCQLQEVFENLLANAVEALDGPGEVFLATRLIENGDGHNVVELSVADTGTGIGADDLPHLFEPFYTTKRDGHGTGLGLSVSRSIIERHGGTITAGNRPQGGAVFTVRLPVHRGET